MKIKLHSITDLITNSSTVIYTYSNSSEDSLKNMINAIFKTFNINKTCDDVFKVSLTLERDYYLTDSNKLRDFIPKELNKLNDNELYPKVSSIYKQVQNCEIDKPDWIKKIEEDLQDNYDYYPPSTVLNIVPKEPQYKEMAELVEKFLYSTTHEGRYDG